MLRGWEPFFAAEALAVDKYFGPETGYYGKKIGRRVCNILKIIVGLRTSYKISAPPNIKSGAILSTNAFESLY
jgi:hypothetical protein